MSNSGKNKSIRKENFSNQKIGAVGFESIEFYHKASAGDKTIDLASLVTPSTELAGEGFSQPSPSVLIGAGIFNKRSSLSLESTLKPKMMDRIAYTIRDNSTIVLKDVAEEGEIFHGTIHNVSKNLIRLPETQTIVATGTLAEGTSTFAVGANFRTNVNPTEQLGEVHVYRNGVLMFRNVSNAVAAEGEDGNYEEVPIGNGFSNEIKFNLDGDVGGEAIHIVSPTRIIKDDGTLLQQVQNVSGVVDIIREDLINEFQFSPNRYDGFSSDVDLKAFNNRVLNLEEILNEKFLNVEVMVEENHFDVVLDHTPSTSTWSIDRKSPQDFLDAVPLSNFGTTGVRINFKPSEFTIPPSVQVTGDNTIAGGNEGVVATSVTVDYCTVYFENAAGQKLTVQINRVEGDYRLPKKIIDLI